MGPLREKKMKKPIDWEALATIFVPFGAITLFVLASLYFNHVEKMAGCGS